MSTPDLLVDRRRKDARTRRDRTERRNAGFALQMEAMVEAYLIWSEAQAGVGLAGGTLQPEGEVQGTRPLQVVDVFSE